MNIFLILLEVMF